MPTERQRAAVTLSDHAYKQIIDRFNPPVPLDFAIDALGKAFMDGMGRDGREVWRAPHCSMVIVREATNLKIVTVVPAGWPVQVLGEPYEFMGKDVPAAPAAIQRLKARFHAR